MSPTLLLVVLALIAVAFIASVSLSPAGVLRAARWFGLGLLGAAGIFLLFSSRGAALLALLPFLLPYLSRLRSWWRMAQLMRGPAPGSQSSVESEHLAMRLDHRTGSVDGQVKQGPFAGRQLSALSGHELFALYQQIGHDPRSGPLLGTFLNKAIGPDWRQQFDQQMGAGSGSGGGFGGGPPPSSDCMSPDEARDVLGLGLGCDEAEIRAAYKRLMVRVHPDQGGSDALAARVNQAKDVLLAQRR
jgi:hypothetical protein